MHGKLHVSICCAQGNTIREIMRATALTATMFTMQACLSANSRVLSSAQIADHAERMLHLQTLQDTPATLIVGVQNVMTYQFGYFPAILLVNAEFAK